MIKDDTFSCMCCMVLVFHCFSDSLAPTTSLHDFFHHQMTQITSSNGRSNSVCLCKLLRCRVYWLGVLDMYTFHNSMTKFGFKTVLLIIVNTQSCHCLQPPVASMSHLSLCATGSDLEGNLLGCFTAQTGRGRCSCRSNTAAALRVSGCGRW